MQTKNSSAIQRRELRIFPNELAVVVRAMAPIKPIGRLDVNNTAARFVGSLLRRS